MFILLTTAMEKVMKKIYYDPKNAGGYGALLLYHGTSLCTGLLLLASRGGCQEMMAVPGVGQQRGMSGIDGSSWGWPVEGDVRKRWQFLVLASRGECQETMAVPGLGQ